MGRIHSIETMGLVDGPGIRFVVFFQGCRLRCAYCHNPDTWELDGGIKVNPEELVKKVIRYRPYFNKSGGGVTCSGGEPLMQPEFLTGFLKLCKQNNIHTAIDTAGFGKGNYEEVLRYTDLVLLDIKHINDYGYRELTGGRMGELIKFRDVLNKLNKKVWIRHVIVPGITDGEGHLGELQKIIRTFNNVEKVELLPYHTLGVDKYKVMKIPYRLKNIKPMNKDKIMELEKIIAI